MPHIHEKIDFTVEVFIVHKNKVLLRKHDKFKIWLSVGGHIEPGEDPVEAAIREVKEETGLDIDLVGNNKIFKSEDHSRELLPPVAVNRHPISKTHEHVVFVYFARSKEGIIKPTYKGDLSEECKWCSKGDLKTLELFPNVRAYATEALKRLKIKN